MERDNALQFDQVSKRYGDFTAVDNLSFTVPAGTMFGLLGGNGAGKTTSIRMILDLVKPSSGHVTVLEQSNISSIRDRIGYLPEERGLYKNMKVLEIVRYFAMLKGMDSTKAEKAAQVMLEKYGLAEFSRYKIQALSKGMSQKVQLISTVVHEPELVILDEPFSGLDPVNQQVLEQLIRDMATNGQTIIFSTHVMQHAERLCNHLLLLARGHKVFDGTVTEAKNTLPKTLVIETDDDITSLRNDAAVKDIQTVTTDTNSGDNVSGRWEIFLREGAEPQQVLQHCFTENIRLRAFEQRNPSLHDVFVHLVGGAQREETVEAAA